MKNKESIKYKDYTISWMGIEQEKKRIERVKRGIKRAEFMIKFWQDEIKYLKDL